MYHIVLLISVFNLVSPDAVFNPLITPPEVIMKFGYPAETHHVVTEDGYIVTLFRIPYSPKSPAAPNKPPVLLHHGLSCTSRDWVLIGPDKALGFLLADEGYDVWLANYRGTIYSRNHTSLSIKNKKFWDFSFHEMAVYDTPAMVDYIIKHTGVEKHYHVGVSMGSTIICAFVSARPEYNKNVRLLVTEGPAVFISRGSGAIYSTVSQMFVRTMKLLGANEISPSPELNRLVAKHVCNNNVTRAICADIVFVVTGYDAKHLNESVLPLLLTHVGVGTSFKTIDHYFQMHKSGKFRMFDYGKLNIQKYGQSEPPDYNLKAITAPLSIMYASKDIFLGVDDAVDLCKAVSNCAHFYEVPSKSFAHFGFVYANNVKPLVNDKRKEWRTIKE